MSSVTNNGSISSQLQQAGISGAGGGGFPTYPKWRQLDSIDHLLVNHQESEANCYADKWIGRERADELADLFDFLLAGSLETVIIGAKLTDREWTEQLETVTNASVYFPEDLPLDPDNESGVVFGYTEDTYELGMENVLLQQVAGVVLGKDLPVDYGWIVQNTETLYNVYCALIDEDPMLEKYVHIDGYLADGSRVPHQMFKAPIGTSAEELLAAADINADTLSRDITLVDGGPGWCFKVHRPADRYGVTKHTNCLMLLDDELIEDNIYGNGRIDVRESLTWKRKNPATKPTSVDPDRVHIATVTNEKYDSEVVRSKPLVEFGDYVNRGEKVAEPQPDDRGFSVCHHATIDGVVSDVTPREIEIRGHNI